MPRPFGVKVGRNKRKRKEKYDREEENEEEDQKVDEDFDQKLPGIPVVPYDPKEKPSVTFILEKAPLQVAKVGKDYEILNSDKHTNYLLKKNLDPAEYRPDIVHQALLTILDSPLNKAGRVRAIYVRTKEDKLFEVKPSVRLPRTYTRFAGVMLQLLQKLSITAVGKREKLFRMIKKPVTQYLPPDSRKIGFSFSSEKLVKMQDYVNSVKDDTHLVFVVGAMAHGKVDSDYVDDYIALSGYPLSAAWCIARIAEAMSNKWGVL